MAEVPYVVHRVWIQGYDKMPDHLKEMNDKFDLLNPELDAQWWDDSRIREELDLRAAFRLYTEPEAFVPADSVMQLKTDIARYAILADLGGVTLDVDYNWYKSIFDLIGYNGPLFAYEVQGQFIANGFAISPASHPLFGDLLNTLPMHAAYTTGKGLRANAFSGPKYLTKMVKNYKDVSVLPARWFHSVPWSKALEVEKLQVPDDAYAVHAWAHQKGLAEVDDGKWRTW